MKTIGDMFIDVFHQGKEKLTDEQLKEIDVLEERGLAKLDDSLDLLQQIMPRISSDHEISANLWTLKFTLEIANSALFVAMQARRELADRVSNEGVGMSH